MVMRRKVFYVNVLRIEKDRKINIKDVLERLNSISNIVRDIDEISKMVKGDDERNR